MRVWLSIGIMALVPGAMQAHSIFRWPDAEIEIPAEVTRFIAVECRAQRRLVEETEDECILGESFGYRAQIALLMDESLGEEAAKRYRICGGGLGSEGARFHRRHADCMGGAFGISWRYEFTRKAELDSESRFDFAQNSSVMAPHSHPTESP